MEQETQPNMFYLNCKDPAATQDFLRLGAEITEPGFVLAYNNLLGHETYNKAVLSYKGNYYESSHPVGLFFSTTRWRWWRLGEQSDLFIAYNPEAKKRNEWWHKIKKIVAQPRVPDMFGTLIVFRYQKALEYNELELRRELINFLVTRYKYHDQYKFFEKK